jgi:hypothetical protein
VTNTDPGIVIQQLFEAAGVKRVISIDDEYSNKCPVEEAVAMAAQLTSDVTGLVFANYPPLQNADDIDIRGQQIRIVWQNVDIAEKRRLTYLLKQRAQHEAPSVAEAVDQKMVTVLPDVFAKYELVSLSLTEWLAQKEAFLQPGTPTTLILIDENFAKEGRGAEEGLVIVKETIALARAKLICALLSHKYGMENIHKDWTALCEKENLDKSKFVLISKASLTRDLIGFARLLKLAILNGAAAALKTKALEILHGANEAARRRLDAIDIYEFDQIVFRSSYREGVWEPDTLFRVFGLFHRDETRKLAKSNVELATVVDGIRRISQIPTESESAPIYETAELERLERYEDGDYLNSHLTPIDTGDIFDKTGPSSKRYILLAQPCDLMVRSDGMRHHTVKEAVLAEIVSGDFGNSEGYAELQFLDVGISKPSFVSFRKTHAVKLSVLDFCAFQADGRATFTVGKACPESVIPAWKQHFKKLSAQVGAMITKFEGLRSLEVSVVDAGNLVASCSNEKLLKAEIDIAAKTITYNLKRIGRLRQPRAAAILTRYANFLARYAFDHDFGERERSEIKDNARANVTTNAVASGQAATTDVQGEDASVVSTPSPATPPPRQASRRR